VADKANYVLMAFQLLVIVFFVALSIGNVVSTSGAGGLVSSQPFVNDTSSFATISAGAAIAAYSFLGFDAVTTLTEETVNPRKTMPRAIMLVALIGGGIFVAVSYVTQLVHPGGVFEDSASAASSIAVQIGGQLFGAVFLAGLVVAQFASGLAAQASASRLMYAMGRDSVLPKAVFGRLNEKFHTPVANLVITGIVGRIAIFLDVATSTSFINFGAFTAFTLVNASVVFHYVRQRRAGQQLNPVSYVVVPVIHDSSESSHSPNQPPWALQLALANEHFRRSQPTDPASPMTGLVSHWALGQLGCENCQLLPHGPNSCPPRGAAMEHPRAHLR
jgi:putrescine importer